MISVPLAPPRHSARLDTTSNLSEWRIAPVIERRESAGTRAIGSLGLCLLLLLTDSGRLAAQDGEIAWSTRSAPIYRLLPEESDAVTDRTTEVAPRFDQVETEIPRWELLERHRLLITTLVPIAGLVVVTANSLIGYDTDHGFRVDHEGWFGANTVNGGADKASHLTDYFVVASVFEDAYRILGHSEKTAILLGFGSALAAGLANEVSDGFTRHGFSSEDFAMDAVGATTASLRSATHTRDLLGMRTSHIPGSS